MWLVVYALAVLLPVKGRTDRNQMCKAIEREKRVLTNGSVQFVIKAFPEKV